MSRKSPRIAVLKIVDFSKEGHGIGLWNRPDNREVSVEVPFSIPGDEVSVEIERHRKLYEGRFPEWIHYSNERVTPLCRHFGKCGGCRWQQIDYRSQLSLKENRVLLLFEPYLNSDVTLYPIIPCDSPWEYRNKMEFSFSSDRAGHRYLGLFLYGSRGRVLQIEECRLIDPWASRVVESVSSWWAESGLAAYHGRSNRGSLRTLTLRRGVATGDRSAMLTVSGNPDDALTRLQTDRFVDAVRTGAEIPGGEGKLSVYLRIQQVAKGRETQFYEILLYGPGYVREEIRLARPDGSCDSLEFRIGPTAFFQPNTKQAEKLYSRAIELTDLSKNDTVYDLYCGTGTLGICIASRVKEVVGIELVPESVLDARENAMRNGLSNVTIHKGDVGLLLSRFRDEGMFAPDAVIVDPPRSGLDSNAVKNLLDLKAPKLTYISCNPITQVANLEDLIKGGYRLKAIQPVDQFPQTVHIENIITLTR